MKIAFVATVVALLSASIASAVDYVGAWKATAPDRDQLTWGYELDRNGAGSAFAERDGQKSPPMPITWKEFQGVTLAFNDEYRQRKVYCDYDPASRTFAWCEGSWGTGVLARVRSDDPKGFAGIWTAREANGSGTTNTLILQKDGTGTWSVSVYSWPIRWQPVAGIMIAMFGLEDSRSWVRGNYDAETNALIMQTTDARKPVFVKVNDGKTGGPSQQSAKTSDREYGPQVKTNFVGTWKHRASEFGGSTFNLRHDGRGLLSAGGMPLLLRWTSVSNRVSLAVADDGMTTNIVFAYNSTNDTLVLKCEDREAAFERIDSSELPNYEAAYDAHKTEERQAQQKFPSPTIVEIENLSNLLAVVRSFAEPSEKRSSLALTSANKKTFSLEQMNFRAGIRMDTVTAGTWQEGLDGRYSKTPPEGVYDLKTVVPQDRLTELTNWCAARQLKYEVGYYLFNSRWKLEGYSQYFSVTVMSNSAAAVDATAHIVEQTMAPFEFPVKAECWRFPTIQ